MLPFLDEFKHILGKYGDTLMAIYFRSCLPCLVVSTHRGIRGAFDLMIQSLKTDEGCQVFNLHWSGCRGYGRGGPNIGFDTLRKPLLQRCKNMNQSPFLEVRCVFFFTFTLEMQILSLQVSFTL